ncbi:YitT family protein [Thalassobacillus sp. CUG 92003]|uniref:YitT family protein n=1 Tax=Thalassobacillus sp. CUG 92003 TaxID=2736641 RepID=UPI0015E79097|nr:YitT family protein [Thalassobacillus sp. CUG 92003]
MANLLKRGLIIIVGSVLLAIGVNVFLVPDHVLDGGMIGIGLIVHYLWGMETGLSIIMLSIPIFIIAWFKYRRYFYNSLHGLLISSFFIDVFQVLRLYHLSLDPAVSSMIGGAFVGGGIGVMLRFQTSTGGTDLLAQMLADLMNINVGVVILFLDLVVISIGGYLFSTQTLMLSALTILSVAAVTMLCTSRITLISHLYVEK